MLENLELYKYFYAVATAGNISAAAKKLYTSQPVVSKYIRRLESELNIQLFVRTSRGVRLTQEGQLLYDYVKTAFDALETGHENLNRIHTLGIGQIRIGVSTTLCKYMLLPYLRRFIEYHPHVRISIQCQSTNHTVKLLEQNKIDIGLIGEPSDDRSIYFYKIADIQDTFIATKAYIDNLKAREHPDNLLETATVMMLDKENVTRQYIDSHLKHEPVVLNNILEVSTMDLIIEFTKIGLGCGCVIRQFVERELLDGRLTELHLPNPIPPRQVGFAVKKQTYTSPSVKAFLSLLA